MELDQLVADWPTRPEVRAGHQALGPGRLPPEVETAGRRLVQEAPTDVTNRSHATLARVVVGRPAPLA